MTYKIDYCGLEAVYENAKSCYTEGELVVLRYSLIATDTDYSVNTMAMNKHLE